MNKEEIDRIFKQFTEEEIQEIPYDNSSDKCCVEEDLCDTGDGYLLCRNCKCIKPIIVDMNYYQVRDTHTLTKVRYTTELYFKERLEQLQGKQSTQIPIEIMEIVKDCETINDIKNTLKKNKKSSYYKHIYSIANKKLIKVPYLNKNEEEQIIFLFNIVSKHLKNDINVLSYNFIMYKLLQHIKRDDLLGFIPQVKNKKKLLSYEQKYLSLNLSNV